jgi:hypothetical protein
MQFLDVLRSAAMLILVRGKEICKGTSVESNFFRSVFVSIILVVFIAFRDRQTPLDTDSLPTGPDYYASQAVSVSNKKVTKFVVEQSIFMFRVKEIFGKRLSLDAGSSYRLSFHGHCKKMLVWCIKAGHDSFLVRSFQIIF